MKNLLPKALPHIIAVIAFLIISFIYVSPVFEGKTLDQHDVKQATSAAKENRDYHEKTGNLVFWAPSMFSGMPAYMIYMDYPNSIPTHIGRFVVYLLPEPANLIFLYMLGCYVAMLMMGFNPYASALGAVAYAFASYNIINIGAGHISKAISVATAPPFVAAIVMTYRGRIWLGGALTALFAAIHQYGNFIQMTYYLSLALGILVIVELILAIKDKKVKQFVIASAVIGFAGILSLATHASRYWATYEYSKETIRGKSDLSDEALYVVYPEKKDTTKTADQKSTGLDKDYAFQWSYGKTETLNLLIPNFSGGSSFESFDNNSETVSTLIKYSSQFGMSPNDFMNALYQSRVMPSMYWGDQPGTGGPAYMGAIIVFLFVFSMIVSKNPLKWWGLSASFLFLMIAWGSNWSWFNDFMFYNFPLFNKFRAVTMILSILPLFMLVVIGLGLKEVYDYQQIENASEKDIKLKELLNGLKYAGIGVGGLVLILAIMGGAFMDFTSEYDQQAILPGLKKLTGSDAFGRDLMYAATQDRQSLMQKDAWRSFIFIGLSAGLIWVFLLGKINQTVVGLGLTLLTLIDLWGVDKRYLNEKNFVSKREKTVFATSADEQILKDASEYRVLNLTVSPFNDATTSYFHHSIGGYHAAKLRRYQNLIEGHISQNNLQVLNMLNTKYIIVQGQNGQPMVQNNTGALGNAWFVKDYKLVENADEEIKALKDFNAAQTAIIDKQFTSQLKDLKIEADAGNTIVLMSETPDVMTYDANVKGTQLAVFSEIYYNNNSGWQAYLDGKPVDHLRVNYTLRGLVIPAGKHKIEFKFEPKSYYKGETIALIASVILLLFVAGGVWFDNKQRKTEANLKTA